MNISVSDHISTDIYQYHGLTFCKIIILSKFEINFPRFTYKFFTMKKGISAIFVLIMLFGFQLEAIGIQSINTLPSEPGSIEATIRSTQQEDTTSLVNTTDTISPAENDTIDRTLVDTLSQDSLVLDTLIQDTLIQDTLVKKFLGDTLKKIIQGDTTYILIQDTLPEPKIDTLILRDTLIVRDTLEKKLPDSLTYFMFKPETKLDSAVAYWNQYALKDSASTLTDSIKNKIEKFLFYAKAHPVDTTKEFIEEYLKTDTTFNFYKDSSRLAVNDSLYQYLSYLWNTTKKDSIQFTLFNESNDSIDLWLTKDPKDSSRFMLYDSKDYPAGVWIKPRNKNSLRLSFVDDVSITETRQQETIREMLPINMNDYDLVQQEHVDMIFPDWDLDGITNLQFNQGFISSNWARGGESSLSTLWNIRYSADYTYGNQISWANDLEYKIGILKSGDKKLRKNEDKLEINSKFGSNAINNWYYSALLNFQTQFFTGYNYPNTAEPVSGFLAPAHLVFSIGMDYNPKEKLTILLSPISSKFTMMRDTVKFDQTKFGIPKNEKVKKELGAYLKSIFTLNFNNDISMENKVNFFINYLEKHETLDIDYEITLNMEVTELINTRINTHLIYDKDISPRIQFKENLSVGFSYKF